MPSVLCLYLINICLTFSILYMLYKSFIARQGPGSKQVGADRGSMIYPSHLCSTHHLHCTCVHHSHYCYYLHPSWPSSTYLWYPTLYMWSQSFSLHSPLNLLHLHAHVQEVRQASHLYLVPHIPLTLTNLVHGMSRPSHPPPHKAWSLVMMVNPGK